VTFHFATCDRVRALEFIRRVYPSYVARISDTPESAGPVLDFVERDVIRIQDPLMHGSTIQVIPGTAWDESERDSVVAACGAMVATITKDGAA
jgi:hypothetical protein